MRLGRFIVETHCHAQRIAARIGDEDDISYQRLREKMLTSVPADEATEDDQVVIYDNSDRLMYDMDAYDVDMCVLQPGAWFENRLNQEIMERHPDTFVSAAAAIQTEKAHMRGEEEWTIGAACDEIEGWLNEDGFRMIGEGVPKQPSLDRVISWEERRPQVREVFELADAYEVPVGWHTGYPSGYSSGKWRAPDWEDPTLAGDIKEEFPDVPIIFQHGGMQGHWRDTYVEKCCEVASAWDDVYLEVGLYWADLMKLPYKDPNIGPEQMIWGGDWGASVPQVSQPDEEPPFYWDQRSDYGLPAHQCDYWGAAMRQMFQFAQDQQIEQDKLNLIMGGNIARLLDMEGPDPRLFEQYLDA